MADIYMHLDACQDKLVCIIDKCLDLLSDPAVLAGASVSQLCTLLTTVTERLARNDAEAQELRKLDVLIGKIDLYAGRA